MSRTFEPRQVLLCLTGRSRAAQVLLHDPPDVDPAFAVNALPLTTWLVALRENWVSEGVMEVISEAGMSTVNLRWAFVAGPGGAANLEASWAEGALGFLERVDPGAWLSICVRSAPRL